MSNLLIRRPVAFVLLAALCLALLPTSFPTADAVGWPSIFSAYGRFDGTTFNDPIDQPQGNAIADLSSGVTGTGAGPLPSVSFAADGDSVKVRLRLRTTPGANTASGWDESKGGLNGFQYMVQVAVAGTHVATMGVDGTHSSQDYVYVAPTSNVTAGGVTYTPTNPRRVANYDAASKTFPGVRDPGNVYARLTNAGNAAAPAETFLDFQIPFADLTLVAPSVTLTTPLQFYAGTSAAANLTTINKDHMSNAGQSCAAPVDCAEVTLGNSEVAAAWTEGPTHVSGPLPLTPGQPTAYDVTAELGHSGLNSLDSVTATASLPPGVVVASATASHGTVENSATSLTWSVGSFPSTVRPTVQLRLAVTPTRSSAGSAAIALLDEVAVSASDAATGIASSATLASRTVGPVAEVDDVAPAAPTLSGTTTTDGTRVDELSWTAVEDPSQPVTYQLYGTTGEACSLASTPLYDGTETTFTHADPSLGAVGSSESVVVATGAARTFTDSAPASRTSYRYCVTATDGAGNVSDLSNTVVITPADVTAPDAPVLSAVAGDGTVAVTWTSPEADDVAGYRLYRDGGLIGSFGPDTLEYDDLDVVNGTTYGYHVVAYDTADNDSDESNLVEVAPRDTTAPAAPWLSGRTTTDGSGDNELDWTSVEDPTAPVTYQLHVTSDGTCSTEGTSFSTGAQRSFTHTGLAPGTSYTYCVTATDGAGNRSAPSNLVTLRPVDPDPVPTPEGLVAGDDHAGGPAGQPLTVDVLANDRAPVGASLDPGTVLVIDAPSHGTITGVDATSGSITYLPDPEYRGPDTFTYRVCDDLQRCTAGRVHVMTPPTDLGITVERLDPLVHGEQVRYRLVVTNHGPWTADAPLDLTVDPSAYLTAVELSATVPGWQFATGAVSAARWGATALSAGPTPLLGSYTEDLQLDGQLTTILTGVVDAPAGGRIEVGASIRGRYTEVVTSNNQATASDLLVVEEAPAPTPTDPGQPSTDPGQPSTDPAPLTPAPPTTRVVRTSGVPGSTATADVASTATSPRPLPRTGTDPTVALLLGLLALGVGSRLRRAGARPRVT